jgi:hypothetical protein
MRRAEIEDGVRPGVTEDQNAELKAIPLDR